MLLLLVSPSCFVDVIVVVIVVAVVVAMIDDLMWIYPILSSESI